MNALEKDRSVRVRFAPSPTGHLHVGGLRSAYFNWLFARHMGGTFLLRIEDTDAERSKKEYQDSQLASLAWCGIASDEPLVIQSQRLGLYREKAAQLVAEGKAYRCYCSPQELERRLGPNAAEGAGYTKYDGRCRDRADQPEGVTYAIRYKLPADRQEIVVHDIIRGEVTFTADVLDDFIILRSDGNPMYNFSVVIDDAAMEISHVIRGDEHLVNTPRQILLYEAFGYTQPHFAHVPLILGSDGTKLSKRDAAVSVIEYKQSGFLPEALCNYLVRLGWSHGDQEIFTQEELVGVFTLSEVGKKGAIFDLAKLTWMNGVFLRKCSAQYLVDSIVRDVESSWRHDLAQWSDEHLMACVELYKERVHTMRELADVIRALYHDPLTYDVGEVVFVPRIGTILRTFAGQLKQIAWERATLEQVTKAYCAEQGLKLPQLLQPLRCALTGTMSSPSVYDLMMVLGRETVERRIEAFCEKYKEW